MGARSRRRSLSGSGAARSECGLFLHGGNVRFPPEALYLDEVHLGPHGNELVANAIAKYVEDHPAGMEFRGR